MVELAVLNAEEATDDCVIAVPADMRLANRAVGGLSEL